MIRLVDKVRFSFLSNYVYKITSDLRFIFIREYYSRFIQIRVDGESSIINEMIV